jgi:hypothetical protein
LLRLVLLLRRVLLVLLLRRVLLVLLVLLLLLLLRRLLPARFRHVRRDGRLCVRVDQMAALRAIDREQFPHAAQRLGAAGTANGPTQSRLGYL